MRHTPVRARAKRAIFFELFFFGVFFFFLQVRVAREASSLPLSLHSLFFHDSRPLLEPLSFPPRFPPRSFAMASALAGRLSGLSLSSSTVSWNRRDKVKRSGRRAGKDDEFSFSWPMLLLPPPSSTREELLRIRLLSFSPCPAAFICYLSIRYCDALSDIELHLLARRRGQRCRNEEAKRLAISEFESLCRRSRDVDSKTKKADDGGCRVIRLVFLAPRHLRIRFDSPGRASGWI